MSKSSQPEQSGKGMAGVVSVIGLVLVWGIVWANLPSKDELLLKNHAVAPPVVPELDLTIPGVPARPPSSRPKETATEKSSAIQADGVSRQRGAGEFAEHAGARARQVAEVKCEAEVQQFCPDSLTGADRRRCVELRLKNFAPQCQQLVRQRLVRWKEAEGYTLACLDDVKRLCPTVQSGEGRVLQCLQDHSQQVSERCHQLLPKGQLLLRN